MARLCQRLTAPCGFGDLALVGFLLVQLLDGLLTYVGIRIWGPGIEANPLISSAIMSAGPGIGLATAKLVAVVCGLILYAHQTHRVVAALTAFYVAAAIVPWTTMLIRM